MISLRSFAFYICNLAVLPWAVAGDPPLSTQVYKVKAAFIYQFTNYIDWPDVFLGSADKPFVIAIVGEPPLVTELKALAEVKTVKGRRLEVVAVTNAAQLIAAHAAVIIVFDEDLLPKIAADLKSSPVLIISRGEGLAKKGAMINFFRDGNRLRFEINRAAVENAKLKVGSQLLKLAKLVE